MADILLDDDIQIANNGDINILVGSDDIVQTAINNLLLRFGELDQHPDIGNKVFGNRFKLANASIPELNVYCSEAILIDSRISNINWMDVAVVDGKMVIKFEVFTVDGIVVSNSKEIILTV